MDFMETPFADEYRLMMSAPRRFVSYRATFVTEAGLVETLQVISIEWIRDYRNAAMDEVLVQLVMPWGQYIFNLMPFKENLKLTLTRETLTSTGSSTNEEIIEETFDAYLTLDTETESLNNGPESNSMDVADLAQLKVLTVQIQEPAEAILRSEMVGGVFRDTRPFDALLSLIETSSRSLDVEDEFRVEGIHAIAPNNNQKRSSIVITHGTPLVQVADKLQRQHGGIYNASIGCYLQKGHWWIWPLYDYKRFDEAEHTALFIVVPTRRLKAVETTYRLVDNHLVALITGGVTKVDPSEVKLLNEGNGTRFADARSVVVLFSSE